MYFKCYHSDTLFFLDIFYKNIEAEICRFKNMNKPEAEISKRMIILSDENLKNYVFNVAVSNYSFLSRQKYPTKRRNLHWSVLMTVR